MLLGTHPEIFNAGEVNNILYHAYQTDILCSCKKKILDCPFWSEVIREWEKLSPIDIETYLAFRNRLEGSKGLKNFLTNQFRFPSEYIISSYNLYESIAKISGKNIILDSSKLPIRAKLVSQMSDIELNFIHLIRDPRGFSASVKRKTLRAPYKSALVWNIVNNWSEKAIQSTPHVQIFYEDLVNDFDATINKLSSFLGLDYTYLNELVEKKIPVNAIHIAAGNPIRMKSTVELKLDTRWKTQLSWLEKMSIRILSFPGMRKYGY
jgi:hypothetical protein